MKKITALDERLQPLGDEDTQENKLPTRREILRMIGNVKADTADDSRRSMRVINKLRDKKAVDLILENDDISYLLKLFEKNPMNLTSWCQAQILDVIESAEKVEAPKV